MDSYADPDPAIFSSLSSANYFLKVHLHYFSRIKSKKEVTKQYLDPERDPDPNL